MNRPIVAFSTATDGDLRHDPAARKRFSTALGVPDRWSTVRQVHGAGVVQVEDAGDAGEADAIFTQTEELPIAVFTADCLGVVLVGRQGIGVAHAGWRGAAAGVVPALLRRMEEAGVDVTEARLGPAIGSCCFEVGPEVAGAFPDEVRTTTWGTTSVDLAAVVRRQLGDLPIRGTQTCTAHDDRWFSHRRDGDTRRLATMAYLSPSRP